MVARTALYWKRSMSHLETEWETGLRFYPLNDTVHDELGIQRIAFQTTAGMPAILG